MPFQMIIVLPVNFCLDHMFLDFNIVRVHLVFLDEKFLKMTEIITGHRYLSRDMGFQTMWYVPPAKPQISLRICAV